DRSAPSGRAEYRVRAARGDRLALGVELGVHRFYRTAAGDLYADIFVAAHFKIVSVRRKVRDAAFSDGQQLGRTEHIAFSDPQRALQHGDPPILILVMRPDRLIRVQLASKHVRADFQRISE